MTGDPPSRWEPSGLSTSSVAGWFPVAGIYLASFGDCRELTVGCYLRSAPIAPMPTTAAALMRKPSSGPYGPLSQQYPAQIPTVTERGNQRSIAVIKATSGWQHLHRQ